MCFETLAEYMHTNNAQMPLTPYINSSFVPINFPTHKVVQTQLVNIQYMG